MILAKTPTAAHGGSKFPANFFCEKLWFRLVRRIELGKRNTLVVSKSREVAGKQRGGGGGGAPNSENRSGNILGEVCRRGKMVKNGGGLAGF